MTEHEDESKKKLIFSTKKKVMTATIGALSSFEEKFGYLWGRGKTSKTSQELAFENIWNEVRKNILDNGNKQVSLFETEMKSYNVDYQPDGQTVNLRRYNG